MRDKLIELIQNAVGGCARHWAELIADALIAHGVTFAEDNNVPTKPMTNGDRIRAMSDEELAKAMASSATVGACIDFGIPSYTGYCCHNCSKCEVILEWLKQPVEATNDNT